MGVGAGVLQRLEAVEEVVLAVEVVVVHLRHHVAARRIDEPVEAGAEGDVLVGVEGRRGRRRPYLAGGGRLIESGAATVQTGT